MSVLRSEVDTALSTAGAGEAIGSRLDRLMNLSFFYKFLTRIEIGRFFVVGVCFGKSTQQPILLLVSTSNPIPLTLIYLTEINCFFVILLLLLFDYDPLVILFVSGRQTFSAEDILPLTDLVDDWQPDSSKSFQLGLSLISLIWNFDQGYTAASLYR